jgi:16S rRNA (cytidine1402-2'-O)-methyltransferase
MLLLCATPIGNLGDLTPRVREALTNCSAVYCEDTRRTLTLLNHIGIKKPLVSCYRENERQRAQEVVARIQAGETVVYVSDAGMPGVSDPGEALIQACIANNLPYSVLPGASAVLMAAVMSGLPAMPFTFFGFFPREKKEQRVLFEQLKRLDHLAVFYESPNRAGATLKLLYETFGNLDAALLRELTKLHEEVARGTLEELYAKYAENDPRGECVLCVLFRAEATQAATPDLEVTLTRLLESGSSVRDAAAEAATFCGVPKKKAYAKALELSTK